MSLKLIKIIKINQFLSCWFEPSILHNSKKNTQKLIFALTLLVPFPFI